MMNTVILVVAGIIISVNIIIVLKFPLRSCSAPCEQILNSGNTEMYGAQGEVQLEFLFSQQTPHRGNTEVKFCIPKGW